MKTGPRLAALFALLVSWLNSRLDSLVVAMKAVLNVETYLHCSQDLRGTQHGLWPGQRFRKRHLPIEYAADLTPVVAAKEARASWNAPGWQKPLDFSSRKKYGGMASGRTPGKIVRRVEGQAPRDRKSTRLNSSHSQISYAVFCLKKKKTT